ncbi:MAG TPA: hypothetical protein VF903_06165 [Nitrospirota bacterium]
MRTGAREGLDPVCPFCRSKLARPTTIKINSLEDALGGRCGCGAFYLVDPTGKNVGEVMMQALNLAAQELSKNFEDLVAGEDYEDIILSYDWRTHRSTGVPTGFGDRYGRLFVVRVKKK